MAIDKKQVMSNSCNASNEKKTAVIDIKGYCVVSTPLYKSIFWRRVFALSLRLFRVRKFRSKSLEAAIISAFMTCSNIATHKEISFSSICANVALFASKDGNYTTATAKRTTKKQILRRTSAGALKKRQQRNNKKRTRQQRPRNRHLEGEIALFKISSLLFQLVRDIKCRRSFLAMALDSKWLYVS